MLLVSISSAYDQVSLPRVVMKDAAWRRTDVRTNIRELLFVSSMACDAMAILSREMAVSAIETYERHSKTANPSGCGVILNDKFHRYI